MFGFNPVIEHVVPAIALQPIAPAFAVPAIKEYFVVYDVAPTAAGYATSTETDDVGAALVIVNEFCTGLHARSVEKPELPAPLLASTAKL